MILAYAPSQVYPTTCEAIVKAFRCYELPSGDVYLLADFNVVCGLQYKLLMSSVALTALGVYGVGIPALFYYRLWMHKAVLHTGAPAPEMQLSFLYSDYEKSFW